MRIKASGDPSIKFRILLMVLLWASFCQGIWAIYHYGYIGQDYGEHRSKLLGFASGFSWSHTNPIGLYWLGHHASRFINAATGVNLTLEVTAFVTLTLNVIALAFIAIVARPLIKNPWLFWATMILITFAPFRAIHSVVLAGDALTILPFFLIASVLSRKLDALQDDSVWMRRWIVVGVILLLAMLCKYSFIGFVPALIGVAAYLDWNLRPIERAFRRFLVVCLCLLPAAGAWAYQMSLSYKVKGRATHDHFKHPHEASAMNGWDLLLPKRSDVELLKAPYYFHEEILQNHRYSYLGLLHLGMFSDLMHFWQDVPPETPRQFGSRTQDSFKRVQSESALKWTRVSLAATLPITFGVWVVGGVVIASRLRRKRKNQTPHRGAIILTLLSLGAYLPIVLSLPQVRHAYYWGYWLPRLVMPSLIGFLILAMHFWDQRMKQSRWVPLLAFGYSCFLAGLFIYIC